MHKAATEKYLETITAPEGERPGDRIAAFLPLPVTRDPPLRETAIDYWLNTQLLMILNCQSQPR